MKNEEERSGRDLIKPCRSALLTVITSVFGTLFLLAMQSALACKSSEVSANPNPSKAALNAAPALCKRTEDMPPYLRMQQYRGITPACVPNGQTLDIPALQQLIKHDDPILIDVWAIVRSVDEDFGSMWLPNREHYSLPDTVWLPNIGYGKIKPDIEQYLQDNLQRLTQGDKAKPLVFFCVMDCWMSWNAVQRVAGYGYSNVYWYRDGTDSWEEAGLPLVEVHPVELK